MTKRKNLLSLLIGCLAMSACFGCGNNANEQAEINSLPKNPASTPNAPAGGGSVGGTPAEFVGQQQRPDGK